MQKLPHTRSCFVCGESNPLGLQLRMETDGRVVHVRYVPKIEHNGFKQVVHGGVLATVLDELMVWACAVESKRFAFCAELNVRFRRPARPGEPLLGTAQLVENRRNKILNAKSELRTEAGELVVEATGKYMPIGDELTVELMADVVPEPDTWQP
jgi:uncharacterized protein (TIGR00369 family)